MTLFGLLVQRNISQRFMPFAFNPSMVEFTMFNSHKVSVLAGIKYSFA